MVNACVRPLPVVLIGLVLSPSLASPTKLSYVMKSGEDIRENASVIQWDTPICQHSVRQIQSSLR